MSVQYSRPDTTPRSNSLQWTAVAPPGFCNRGEVRYGSIGSLEYEVPQSRLYCLCINVALCSTALQCICRVIRSSTTMKAHTYYTIFGRPAKGGKLPPSAPWRRHWWTGYVAVNQLAVSVSAAIHRPATHTDRQTDRQTCRRTVWVAE